MTITDTRPTFRRDVTVTIEEHDGTGWKPGTTEIHPFATDVNQITLDRLVDALARSRARRKRWIRVAAAAGPLVSWKEAPPTS